MNARMFRILSFLLVVVVAWITAPVVAYAAEEGNKWGVWLGFGRLFNLLLVAGVLVWATRKPLTSFFAGRTRAIREQLAEAQEARREAEAKLAEMQLRMSRRDDELREIKEAAEKESEDEYRRMMAAAESDAEKIIERSRTEIEGMARAAQLELKAHVAELSIRLAEERLQREMTEEDRGRLFERFVTRLGEQQQ